MAIKKFKSGTGGNSFLIFLIVLVAVIVFVTFAKVTQSTFRTETYYVLAGEKDTKVLSTNDVITPEMLVPVTTSEAPENALDVSEFQDGKRRARYDLNGRDILTESNTADELHCFNSFSNFVRNFSSRFKKSLNLDEKFLTKLLKLLKQCNPPSG